MAEAKRAKKTTKAGPKKAAPKSATKKATPAAKKKVPKRKDKTPPATGANFKPLTEKEIEDFRLRLLDLRRQLVGDVDHMRAEALKDSRQELSGDLSSMPIHMADIGTDNYEQEFTLGLIESDRKMLKEIDLALKRIPDGLYGVCEATQVSIGRARLQAKPYARYCIDHARKVEQGLVFSNDENGDDGPAD